MLIAANFKTFKTRQETLDYYRDVKAFIEKNEFSVESMIFPPATAFNTFRGPTVLGTQNAYAVENGAFTGEIGLNQLKEFETQESSVDGNIGGAKQTEEAKKE